MPSQRQHIQPSNPGMRLNNLDTQHKLHLRDTRHNKEVIPRNSRVTLHNKQHIHLNQGDIPHNRADIQLNHQWLEPQLRGVIQLNHLRTRPMVPRPRTECSRCLIVLSFKLPTLLIPLNSVKRSSNNSEVFSYKKKSDYVFYFLPETNSLISCTNSNVYCLHLNPYSKGVYQSLIYALTILYQD